MEPQSISPLSESGSLSLRIDFTSPSKSLSKSQLFSSSLQMNISSSESGSVIGKPATCNDKGHIGAVEKDKADMKDEAVMKDNAVMKDKNVIKVIGKVVGKVIG
eukprot:781581_1